ncbi:threonylcarbamoyl-AMP synthase [Arsenophonus endosymbiont of Aphis craccivora]|uniref:L-threonylcarbamoyladenylate synthase n=1 Tax=Arsenophonus endosymbiont of Aphis craccivora TaxID=1231049 RepID=UPI0015DCEE87|nr:L-threonylcarbamoyladenylate synthase [Arsenophonus endosymbiont of Aphis craccivora]QLK87011.1 threonylcarbamoyl-AMP synthase [Arsenophonus endosymbiont of Aphis craccivora]
MGQSLHIHPQNLQLRLINQCIEILNKGGIIVYPTDSGYAMGCKLDNKNALMQICRLSQLDSRHNFTLMCRDLSEIAEYAYLDNQVFRMIKNSTPGHYTFILRATKEVPRRIMNKKRKTIGIRLPNNPIARDLLAGIGEPLLSTSLILPGEDFAQSSSYEIESLIGQQVDLIINVGYLSEKPTTVVDLTESMPNIIRVGMGSTIPFE